MADGDDKHPLLTHLKTIPNQLTLLRLLLIPVMWGCALQGWSFPIGIGLFIALVTDAFDGMLARWLEQTSAFGSKFDSLADNLLIPSVAAWMLMLYPGIWNDHAAIILLALGIYAASMLTGLVKFRRFANLHLHLSRAGALVQLIFVIHAMLTGDYNRPLFYLSIGLFILSSSETLLLMLSQSQVDEHMGSLLLVLLRRKP